MCPKCKSAYWDVARKLGKNEMNTNDNKSDNLETEQQRIEKIKRSDGRRTKPDRRRKIGFTLFRDHKTNG